MTAELINLRQARKRRRRDEAARQAAGNRQRFGRTQAEKAETRLQCAMDQRKLEAHRRGSSGRDDPEG